MAKKEMFTTKMMGLYERIANESLHEIIENREMYEDESIKEHKDHRQAIRIYDMCKEFEEKGDRELSDALLATALWFVYTKFVMPTEEPETFIVTEAEKKPGVITQVLNFDILSEYLIRKYCIVSSNDIMYIYVNDKYYEDKGRVVKDIVKLLKKSRYSENRKIEQIIRDVVFRIKSETMKFEIPFNKSAQYLIPVVNGVVVRKTINILLPKSPVWGFTYSLPATFDPTAKTDGIETFLEDIAAPEDVEHLKQVPAQALMQSEHYQQAYLLTGGGSNGKSTYISLLRALMGKDNITSVSLQAIVEDKFKAAELQGKLMNLYPDLPKESLKSTGIFKALTGGDAITVEKKFHNPFALINKAVFVFSANELPEVADSTFAFWRRWVIIELPNQFPVDEEFVHRLITPENLSGFLNLVIKEMDEIEKKGIKRSERVEKAMEMWRNRSNTSYAFIHEMVEMSKEDYIPKDGLYSEYSKYCGDNDITVESKHKFTDELIRMGVTIELVTMNRQRVRVFKGIKHKGEPSRSGEKKEDTKDADITAFSGNK
jgi:P4 family phage/plasmid primase-like protien